MTDEPRELVFTGACGHEIRRIMKPSLAGRAAAFYAEERCRDCRRAEEQAEYEKGRAPHPDTPYWERHGR